MSQKQPTLFDSDLPAWEFDDASQQTVATVVFVEPPHGPFDYRVPEKLLKAVAAGCRLRVPLGRGDRGVIGYCVKVENRSVTRSLKEVRELIDARSLLSASLLELAQWMSDYYLCPLGQALECVIPAGVRGQAGTREVTLLSVPTAVAARLTQLELPPKQAEILRFLAASPRPLTPQQLARAAKCTTAPIKALREKKLIAAERQRVQQFAAEDQPEPPGLDASLTLNAEQQQALDAILAALHGGRHETILLHGVTGSGKTEVYIRAIEALIGFGRQAIVLVPEISLTPQTRQRFRSRFERVAVLHSHLSDAERHWHWERIARGEVQVVVGARSAVFAPIQHLGLIVLDEEHDGSFKQDNAPRYHARDVALQRARMEKIPLVLGSATPALDSWHRTKSGAYRLAELTSRVLARPLPDVTAIDLRNEFQGSSSRGAVSRPLHQAIHRSLQDGGQVILLLNRRGYSTSIQCPSCGGVVKCTSCDIALTHHREQNTAVCHYCDYTIPAPQVCPECQFTGIRFAGFGTQKLEQEIRSRFPDANCLRMDYDTMRKPGSHEQAFAKFRSGECKILLGTQMIAKGLDFPNVTLVGVINADIALHLPDFRAAERTFQLVTQVAGRTGRGEKGGRVLVQTFSPEHPAIQAALRHDYAAFARGELPVRREFGYPPCKSMIRLIVRGPAEAAAEGFTEHLAGQIAAAAEQRGVQPRVLGPAPAPIAKLQDRFRFHLLVIHEDLDAIRAVVRDATRDLQPPAEVQFLVDVEPLDLL